MSQIKSSTGLASGLDIGKIVDALVNAERASARRLEARKANIQAQQSGLSALQAQLLSLSSTVVSLKDRNTFTSLAVQNSDPAQLKVTSKLTSLPGQYQFQSVQLASNQRSLSRGFANPDNQQIGTAGQLVISRNKPLNPPTKIELLNGGQGIRRGVIEITDRSGASAEVDLQNVVSLSDVTDAINNAGIGVRAETLDGSLVLRDTTGETAQNLSVREVGGGHAATDLGLLQSVSADTLTGSDILAVTEDFTLNLLNDGNRIRHYTGSDDVKFTLADGSTVSVNVDNATTVGDLLHAINDDTESTGKLSAALQNGRLVLTDQTTGTETFSVTDLPGSNATKILGLDVAATGNTLTGRRLLAGANSVLLRNLRGGQGITQLGEVSLTDRTGATATIDLSQAESLDEVLAAINSATTSGNVALQLHAEINSHGDGLVVRDTSGATASNLIIADVGGSTLAADLGIAVDTAQAEIAGAALGMRSVNEATSLATYSPRGGSVARGSFKIQDSAGNIAVVNIGNTDSNLGDVLDRINNAAGINVTARLNDTGDGIVLVDDAAGAGTLTVTEVGGRTAADLRLLGSGTVGGSGKQEIVSRNAAIIDVAATDTLTGLATKINAVGGTVRASVINSGAALNGFRLTLSSTLSGQAGRFTVSEGNLDLGFTTQETGRDAVLRVGSDPATGFLLSSSSNTFANVPGNFDITLQAVGTTAATVLATRDADKIQSTVQSFVTQYNNYVELSKGLTKYDVATQSRAALQGTAAPLQIQARFNALINRVTGAPDSPVRSLADAGLKLTTGGKLSFDEDKLSAAIAADPDAIRDLFASGVNGFGTDFDKALNYFNDDVDGTLTAQNESLQKTADSLTSRIAAIDLQLDGRRARLEQQFAQMETILSGLQSQQTSLSGLSTILSNLKYSNN